MGQPSWTCLHDVCLLQGHAFALKQNWEKHITALHLHMYCYLETVLEKIGSQVKAKLDHKQQVVGPWTVSVQITTGEHFALFAQF